MLNRHAPAFLLLLAAAGIARCSEADELIAKLVAQRESITSYRLRATVETHTQLKGEPRQSVRRAYEVWSQSGRLRTDYNVIADSKNPDTVGQRHIKCRGCEQPGHVVTAMKGPKTIMPVEFHKIGPEYDKQDYLRIDWRMAGLVDKHLARYFSSPTNSFLRLVSSGSDVTVKHEGAITLLEKVTADGSTFRCAMSADYGGNPVRLESQVVGPKGQPKFGQQVTETTYRRDDKTGLWFPATVKHKTTVGESLIVDETITFESVCLNCPIPDSVFTLGGFGLFNGFTVMLPEVKKIEDQPTLWDGALDKTKTWGKQSAELSAKLRREAAAAKPVLRPAGSRRKVYLLATALLFTGLALFFYRVSRRRARAARDEAPPERAEDAGG